MSGGDIAGTMILGVLAVAMVMLFVLDDDPPWWQRMTTRACVAFVATALVMWPVVMATVALWLIWIVARNIVGAFRELWRAFFPRPDRTDLPRAEVRK